MLLVDSNEERNQPELLRLLRESVDVSVEPINQTAGNSVVYPDYVVWGGDKLVGINRKQVGEILSSLDRVEEQLQRELAGPCEHLALLIEGVMGAALSPLQSGLGTVAYSFDWKNRKLFNNFAGTVPFTQHISAVSPKHIANWQTRLEFKGVQVVHTYSTSDTASKLIAMHDMVLKGEPNRVLNRLIKTEFSVLALDPVERAMALTLMGIAGAGLGEELALSLASTFSSVVELVRYWDAGGTIADLMVREKTNVRTRRVGNAAERRLQAALGYTTPDSTRPGAEAEHLSPAH